MSKFLTFSHQLVALTLVVMFVTHSWAQVYEWKDEKGNVVFSDKKPESGVVAKSVDVKVANSYKDVKVETLVTSSDQGVVMYSTQWCGYCKQARAHFARNNIAYTDKDIEKSKSAKREHKRLGGTGVPLIVVGKQKMKGFSAARFDQIYGANR